MYSDPELPGPRTVFFFPEKAKALWLKALERPEADIRRQSAEAVALAYKRGAPARLGLAAGAVGLLASPLASGPFSTAGVLVPPPPGTTDLGIFIEPLSRALDQPDQHPTVRLAAAQALIVLDARDAAPILFRRAQSDGSEMRELVEPALARWDYRPARAVWLERLGGPAASQRALVLAIQSLAIVGENQAADPLRKLVLSEQTAAPIRLEAARALGALRTKGLEKDAEQLAGDASAHGILGRLLAASLLERHRGDEAVQLLKRLADDVEPAIARLTVARLLEIDPDLLAPAVEGLLSKPDASLRSLAVDVLYQRPSADRIHLLAERLNDADTAVRRKALEWLLRLAENKSFKDRIITEGRRVLGGKADQWRGLEQATILLTLLDDKSAAERLVQLLSLKRPEAAVTAAWGLRKLADPQTLRPVVDYVTAKRDQTLQGVDPFPSDVIPLTTLNHQLSQLIQFLGEQRDQDADLVLRRYLPRKGDQGLWEAKAAAAWALGRIHEGTPEAKLTAELLERLDDVRTIPPEEPRVRRMAAISLGRIKAVTALAHLHDDYCPDQEPSGDAVRDACGWAAERLSTDPRYKMHDPKTTRLPRRAWFLTPDD